MRINSLYIDGYKNLNEVELRFSTNSTINALIGNNGSGKSNIIEAIGQIFSAAYNNVETLFTYELKYTLNGDEIVISNRDKKVFTQNGKNIPKSKQRFFLPRTIFLYYCGETDRLKNMSVSYQDKAFESSIKNQGELAIKYISYVGLNQFPGAFLANAAYHNETYNNVCALLGVTDLEGPITFRLKRPIWSKKAPITSDSFWNATGTVAMLLHKLSDQGSLTIIDKDNAQITLRSVEELLNIDSENPFDLFVRFELLMQAGILAGIEFNVMKYGKSIALDSLSEGEKQLAQLLCLLEATKEHRALFLLDEFDSFLHPNWQRRFAEIISNIEIKGQILISTHSPLTLGKMKKDNIFILKDGTIYQPAVETYNRDITEVLEEIMDVGKRPEIVEDAIKSFRSYAARSRKEEALLEYDNLKKLLSVDDPFWNTAAHLLARLNRR